MITALLAVSAALCQHGSPLNTLIIANSSSPTSITISDYYLSKRSNVTRLFITTQDSAASMANESISYTNYFNQIQIPIAAYLSSHPEIYYVVLTKGIPIRINSHPTYGYIEGGITQPSVDSVLASLGYESNPNNDLLDLGNGQVLINNFWGKVTAFVPSLYGGYLVTRLDGYSIADAEGLVDRSLAAHGFPGSFLFDTDATKGYTSPASQPKVLRFSPHNINPAYVLNLDDYNSDMEEGSILVTNLLGASHVILDKTNSFLSGTNLNGYVSYGSNDSNFNGSNYNALSFVPGGIADTAVSTSARTLFTYVTGQSLIAELVKIRTGQTPVTGIKGDVVEPYLDAITSPSLVFPNYIKGDTLAEAFYSASRFLGWEDLVLGDPLCRPKGPTIYGYINLGPYAGDLTKLTLSAQTLAGSPVTQSYALKLIPTSTPGLATYSLSLNNTGTYYIRFSIAGEHWLSRVYTVMNVSDYTQQNIVLPNGDTNRDGVINDSDLLIIINTFLQTAPAPPAADLDGDVNGDRLVDDSDLLIVINNFLAASQ